MNKLHLMSKNINLPFQVFVQFYLCLISGFPFIILKTELLYFPD